MGTILINVNLNDFSYYLFDLISIFQWIYGFDLMGWRGWLLVGGWGFS
jgi:hypothetical protein